MPSLADHTNAPIVKLLYIGDSGTGKTGSLTSLVNAGYKLRVLDFDNNIGTLKSFVLKECKDKIGNVEYVPLRDQIVVGPSSKYGGKSGPVVKDNAPKAFTEGLKLLEKWTDGSDPAKWGAEYILVIDTLSSLGRAAYDWAFSLNPSAKDPRQWFFAAQQGVENLIALLTSESFNTNVIVVSHVNWKEVVEGTTKGYANAIGTAIGPILHRYFNTLLQAETSGIGKTVTRVIRTMPTGLIDLKTPVSYKIEQSYPLGTGLATLFSAIKDQS